MLPRQATAGAAVVLAAISGATVARALEEAKDEKDRLKACEATLCSVVTKKGPPTGDLVCSLQKTWVKQKIQEGAAAGRVSWAFGDARCKLEVKVPRADIVKALTAPEHTLQFPEHVVHCEIERDKELTPVRLKFAPKVTFKNGQAKTAWVNLKDVDGPATMKGLAYTVAKLEDGLGLFHKGLINAINGQIGPKCEKAK